MVSYGIFVRLEAKEGKEEDVAEFLTGALDLVNEEEGTTVLYAVRFSPSWVRAKTWMRSRISALLGRSLGLTDPRHTRAAALRLAVKYSDSVRSYIRRAASNAIA